MDWCIVNPIILCIFVQNQFNNSIMSTKIHLSSVRKDLEYKLEIYSVDDLIVDCRRLLKVLKQYPISNKWQIKYYEKFWILLSEY